MPKSSLQPDSTAIPANVHIYSVSELNREARLALEESMPAIWVAGELSNFARPGSGHWYFSLKDADSQVRCAMFRGANRGVKFAPNDGKQVIIQARVTIYEPRGSYQLIAEHMEPAGEGLLRQKFEALKNQLSAEGLFTETEKKPLPDLPRRIGIITSPTGAAVRDILHILKRRFPSIPAIIYPVQVQGEQAKHEIAAALKTAGERDECDVLIVGRGGGSLEDLWAFNEEMVARAIFDCPIPVISAVGHEVDFTIADLVADLRAPTPSGAAELAVPDRQTWLQTIESLRRRASHSVRRTLESQRTRLTQLNGRLERRNPVLLLQQTSQQLDDLILRSARAVNRQLKTDRLRLDNLAARLRRANPDHLISTNAQSMAELNLRLKNAMRNRIETRENRLSVLAARLQTVSPLNTLQRGYAIIESEAGVLVRSIDSLKPEDCITGRLAEGQFTAIIK
ncbi:MAG: exodeoxyribonuclease VII large subunit, partial [Gammaproteobacteria bacterium]|nr:exodeoxyribonuclease VII large subunit [Gammaproteobacteria bacterium]